MSETRVTATPLGVTRPIPVGRVRTDGKTQHRAAIKRELVQEYAELMRHGTSFPPVKVWWDGDYYWLADGFHRFAAAQALEMREICAEIHEGSVAEAQWDSYAANGSHGLRRTGAEKVAVFRAALSHPNAKDLSNLELARHLHLPETTVRRWRKNLSPPNGEDSFRVVKRNGKLYRLAVAKIGCGRAPSRLKRRDEIRSELAAMKEQASPEVRRLLNIVGNWALGSAGPAESVAAMERVVTRQTGRREFENVMPIWSKAAEAH